MPISRQGWEIHFVRTGEQARPSKRRTVGTYQVFHDGVAQTRADMRGVIAETRGPGANRPAGNNRRVEAGTYPLFTQDGTKYVTIDFNPSESSGVLRKPGIELKETGQRREILIHPGRGFLASVGCINLAGSLPNAAEDITYTSSRRRVIAVIDDMRVFLGAEFPTRNGRRIPRAFAVIDGEP